jgi:hypothetical protein
VTFDFRRLGRYFLAPNLGGFFRYNFEINCTIGGTAMRGAIYYEYSVLVHAKQNGQGGLWIPDIHITSQVGNHSPQHLIHSACYNTRDEAEEHGLEMAREWICRQYQIPPKD